MGGRVWTKICRDFYIYVYIYIWKTYIYIYIYIWKISIYMYIYIYVYIYIYIVLVEISISIYGKHLPIQVIYLHKKGYAWAWHQKAHAQLYSTSWLVIPLRLSNFYSVSLADIFPVWVFTQLRNPWSSIWWLELCTSKGEKTRTEKLQLQQCWGNMFVVSLM